MEINDKLARIIRIPPLLITAVFTIILVSFMMVQSHDKAEMLIVQLRKDHLADQKRQLRTRVSQLALHIQYQSEAFYRNLAFNIQERIDTAFDIANELYKRNRGESKEEILSRLVSALRNIRYNNGQGEYFIYTLQGQAIMVPSNPGLEGSFLWDRQDLDGVFYVRELVRKARAADHSLFQWTLGKSDGDTEKACEQIGSASYFAPCDVIIGVREQAEDLKENLQRQLLDWVQRGYTRKFDRLFIFDNKGQLLVDPALQIAGMQECSPDRSAFTFGKIAAMEGKGGFISHLCKNHGETIEILSYLAAVPDWQWVLGAMEDKEVVNKHLADKIAVTKQQNRADLLQLLLGCLAIMGMVAWLTFYLSRRVSRQVYEKMMFDELTGLPNRNYFTLQVQSEIQTGKTVVVLNVDIDEFSAINERFNRSVGDMLLRKVADRLREVVDDDSQLCRVSGDEFLLYFKELVPCELSNTDAQPYIGVVKDVLRKPFLVGREQVRITCAIGAVCTGGFRSSANELLRRANIVLFRAKNEGKDRHSCYNSGIEKVLQRDKAVADALVVALSHKEIHVVYQPQILSENGKIYAVEALCRWTSASLGFVAPDEFIPIAEKSGFILPLGFYVFRRACEDVLKWMANGDGAVKVSINISPRQLLHSGFISEIHRIVKEVGISPERITLEITENLLITDLEEVKPILERLDSFGFEISLDDFGTGESSLVHIHRLPIVELKIDRTFVARMIESYQAASLVKSILAISRSNALRIVAEGVETAEHVDWLKKHNCDLFQGYFFSKPVDMDVLQEMYPVEVPVLTER